MKGHRAEKGETSDYADILVFFLFLLIASSFYTLLFFIIELFPKGDREELAGPRLPNEAFVGTSALCSKTELQPADPAI